MNNSKHTDSISYIYNLSLLVFKLPNYIWLETQELIAYFRGLEPKHFQIVLYNHMKHLIGYYGMDF